MRGGEDVRAEAEWAVSFSCSYFAQVWSYLLRSRWVVTAQRLHRAALVSKTMAESAEEVQVVRKRNQKKKKREDVDSDEAASEKRKRVLKRKKTNADIRFSMEWLVCWAAGNQGIAVGPSKTEHGIRCILVSPNAKWLKELAFGHKTWQSKENTYIDHVVSKLKDIVRSINPHPLDVGGAALGEGHSSNEEASNPEAVENGGSNANRPVPQWTTITVNEDGETMSVLAKRGNGIFIPYTGEAVTIICNLVHQSRRHHEADTSDDPSSLLIEADENKIIYNRKKKAYKVMFTPKKRRDGYKYFEVHNGDAPPVLSLARRFWNQFDSSPGQRYLDSVL